jgi:DNA-binding response OmpR family regulator
MKDYRILVVDDEDDLCEVLKFNLEDAGYRVDTANSAEEALTFDLATYDLLLLDVMMGEISGFKMAAQVKKNKATADIPIVFLTAKDTEGDTVAGFNLGADDYIFKPFSVREVLMRVRAILRRTNNMPATVETQLTYRNLVVDLELKEVTIADQQISLTKKEYEILVMLLSDRNRVFSRDEILSKIWMSDGETNVLDRTVDVNITRLRRKIGEYGACIVTRLGYGYCFEAK